MKKYLLLILVSLFSSKSIYSQEYSPEQQRKIKEYFSTWTYDSLVTEGSKSVIVSALNIDMNINQKDTQQKLEFAVLALNEANNRKKNNPDVYSWRGLAKRFQGKYLEALTDFSLASKLEPNNIKHYADKAKCKSELKDYYGAIDDYTKAINRTNKNEYSEYHNLFAQRAFCYLMQGKDNLALKDCNKAIEITNQKSTYFLYRGLAKQGLNQIKGACLDFSKAGELGNIQAYDLISEYCND